MKKINVLFDKHDFHWLVSFICFVTVGHFHLEIGFVAMSFACLGTMLMLGRLRYKIREEKVE